MIGKKVTDEEINAWILGFARTEAGRMAQELKQLRPQVERLKKALETQAFGEILKDCDIKPTSPEFDIQVSQLVDFWLSQADRDIVESRSEPK